jgi:hypothetical protein
MSLALLLAAAAVSWVPAVEFRGSATVAIYQAGSINCALAGGTAGQFSAKAKQEGWRRSVRPAGRRSLRPRSRAVERKLTGVVPRANSPRMWCPRAPAVGQDGSSWWCCRPRRDRLDSDDPIIGTAQGVWPGINTGDDGSAKAAPPGPWIDTNSGFCVSRQQWRRRSGVISAQEHSHQGGVPSGNLRPRSSRPAESWPSTHFEKRLPRAAAARGLAANRPASRLLGRAAGMDPLSALPRAGHHSGYPSGGRSPAASSI